MAQPRFPSSLLWAGQRRMRPGTPSSRGGRSFALSVGGCVVSPVHAIRSLRSLRRGKNAFKLLQIGDHRDSLGLGIFCVAADLIFLPRIHIFSSRPLNLCDTISVRSPGLHSFCLRA